LITQIAIFFQELADGLLQLGRHFRIQLDHGNRIIGQERMKNHGGSVPGKRHFAGGHLIDDGA